MQKQIYPTCHSKHYEIEHRLSVLFLLCRLMSIWITKSYFFLRQTVLIILFAIVVKFYCDAVLSKSTARKTVNASLETLALPPPPRVSTSKMTAIRSSRALTCFQFEPASIYKFTWRFNSLTSPSDQRGQFIGGHSSEDRCKFHRLDPLYNPRPHRPPFVRKIFDFLHPSVRIRWPDISFEFLNLNPFSIGNCTPREMQKSSWAMAGIGI